MKVSERRSAFGYESLIEVTACGRVFSKVTGKELKTCDNGRGYLVYKGKVGSVHVRIRVHRVVALTFIENPDNKPVVNHKDRNKKNNQTSNLEWSTYSENTTHYYKTKYK